MDYYDDMEDSMVPERDASNAGGYNLADEMLGNDPDNLIMKTSAAAFNQQRAVVSKLSRGEIEDRYLRLLEENVVLKKHAVKQEEKIKKLATKLIRVMSDKKRLEIGGPNTASIRGHHRDLETEELIEDQQQRIRELERSNGQLKDKLMVAKQQILAINQQNPGMMKPKRSGSTIPRSVMGGHSPQQTPSLLMPSPTPTRDHQLLSQQAQHLLEEARNENQMLGESVNMLKEQVNMLELEVEQTHEQAKIKEANYEEEMSLLKEQLKERNYQDVAENIELIRLQQDKKAKATQMTTLKAQVRAFEEEVSKFKADIEKLKSENSELSTNLSEEQRKSISLTAELSNNSSSKQALIEAEEKMRDLQKENAILRESNAKLLDSAYNVERERQFTAAENALKVQVAQLEATLKSDLNDKKLLSEALGTERENLAKMEVEFQELQSRYFTLKESMEGHEEKLKFFAQENSIDAGELEQALLFLRQKATPLAVSRGHQGGSFPEFLEPSESSVAASTATSNEVKDLRTELSQVQAHHVEAVNELEKTRSLLRVQANINQEQKHEIEALQQRLFQVKSEFQSQIGEYKKLLDMRAARIHKLETQVRDGAYGQVSKQVNMEHLKSHTVHTPSGQTLFEIHVQKVNLTKECLLHLGTTEPRIFATWTFYEHDMQYTPVIKGPQALLDCSAYYKVKLDDAFLDFLMDSSVIVEVHMATEDEERCKTIGQAELKLSAIVHYPHNKLHGSVLINSCPTSGSTREPTVVGSLDFWFKLHEAATSRIQEWLDRREEVNRALEKSAKNAAAQSLIAQVDLLEGEQRVIHLPENQEKLVGRRKLSTPEPEPAPRVKPAQTVLRPVQKVQTETTETIRKDVEEPEAPPKKMSKSKRRLVKSKGTVVEDDVEVKTEQPPEPKEETPKEQSLEKPIKNQVEPKEPKMVEAATEEKPTDKKEEEPESPKDVKEELHSAQAVTDLSLIEGASPPKPKPRGPIQVTSSDKKEKSDWDEDDQKDVKQAEPELPKEAPKSKDDDASEEESENEEEEEESEEEEEEESEESEEEESEEDEPENPEDKTLTKEKPASKEEEEEEEDSSTVQESSSDVSSSKKPEKKLVKEDSQTTITGDSSSTSHDSEGVVVRKSSLVAGNRNSVLGSEAITITISEFKAGKNANFLKNKKIQKLFVEYSFLDLKPEETETPFALPKPKTPGESIVFNFSKVIPMDKDSQAGRRKLLSKVLQEDSKESKNVSKFITFSLVSEPEESEDGKCEDVGTATVDLEALYKSEQDLVDAVLDVHSVEPQTRVSKFLGSKKVIGTLTVSVIASDVFKSLKL